jgi:hypothetical protein
MSLAQSSTEPSVAGEAQPLLRVKKAGNSVAPSVTTATPCVSCTRVPRHGESVRHNAEGQRTKNSSVRGMSRMDLTPAQITVTGVRPSSVRSAARSRAAGSATAPTHTWMGMARTRHVHGLLHAAVHAADAAGDEESDTGSVREVHGASHGRGAVALRDAARIGRRANRCSWAGVGAGGGGVRTGREP